MTDARRIAEEVLRKGESALCDVSPLARAVLDYEKKLREADNAWKALTSAICKEPPCMYGSNERVYILSLIEAARARETSRTGEKP